MRDESLYGGMKRFLLKMRASTRACQESIYSDTLRDLNTLLRSSDFDAWLSHLADQKAKARILARLASATFGNFGDGAPVGEGVSEMRIHVAAGYRVYYTRTGSTVYVLLAGGVKGSQTKDIAKAKRMARELKRAKPRGGQ
jgi:putative addiction module killer protein